MAARYSRPLALDVEQVEPGDQVNIANPGVEPYWLAVANVGECGEDPDDESDHCDGDCLGVLTLQPVDDSDPRWWHVQPHEHLSVLVSATEPA